MEERTKRWKGRKAYRGRIAYITVTPVPAFLHHLAGLLGSHFPLSHDHIRLHLTSKVDICALQAYNVATGEMSPSWT